MTFKKWELKINFFPSFFCLLLFVASFTSYYKDKKSQNSWNQGFFLLFSLDDKMIRKQSRTSYSWIGILEAQKHTDPDPQHGLEEWDTSAASVHSASFMN